MEKINRKLSIIALNMTLFITKNCHEAIYQTKLKHFTYVTNQPFCPINVNSVVDYLKI